VIAVFDLTLKAQSTFIRTMAKVEEPLPERYFEILSAYHAQGDEGGTTARAVRWLAGKGRVLTVANVSTVRRRMVESRLLSASERGARFYRVTDAGKRALQCTVDHYKDLVEMVGEIK